MTCKYGAILPHKTLSIWNGIGRGQMADRIDGGPWQERNLANSEPLAQLQKLRCRYEILPRRSLAQKIDIEIGRDRKADGANRRQQHHIHRAIRQRHQRSSRDGSAGTKHIFTEALPYLAGPTVGVLDCKIVIIKHKRKLGAQEGTE